VKFFTQKLELLSFDVEKRVKVTIMIRSHYKIIAGKTFIVAKKASQSDKYINRIASARLISQGWETGFSKVFPNPDKRDK